MGKKRGAKRLFLKGLGSVAFVQKCRHIRHYFGKRLIISSLDVHLLPQYNLIHVINNSALSDENLRINVQINHEMDFAQ